MIDDDKKQEVRNLLLEQGEKISDRIINDLFSFTKVTIEERWVGDVKRVIWGKLKENVLNIGGNYRLRIWEENVKRNVTYIDPPKNRFNNDPTGRKNAFLDVKPLSSEYIKLRDERQAKVHTLTWDEFSENVAINGKYKTLTKSNIESMTEKLEKGQMSEKAFNSYLNFHERYEGFHYHYIYSLFKDDLIQESEFIQYIDNMLYFNEEYGAVAQGSWYLGSFSEYTK